MHLVTGQIVLMVGLGRFAFIESVFGASRCLLSVESFAAFDLLIVLCSRSSS
jgi:hypothetical protein